MESTYNGWRNYETWLTNLWLNNDQGTYTYWRKETRLFWHSQKHIPVDMRWKITRVILAHCLKDVIEKYGRRPEVGLYSELLNAALSAIDWYEVAEAFLEGIPDEEQDEQSEG